MKLSDAAVARLELDDDVREMIDRARTVTTLKARRRAERTLAGDLRRIDLAAVAEQVENVRSQQRRRPPWCSTSPSSGARG